MCRDDAPVGGPASVASEFNEYTEASAGELTEQIVRLLERCSGMRSSIRVMQIAGVRQPADELSRERAHDLEKVAVV